MAGRERSLERGTRLGRAALARLGQELRDARLGLGLSLDAVATAVGISASELSRIERALAHRVPAIVLFRIAAVVGLDLSVRTYPGASPLRDAVHGALLAELRRHLHSSLLWSAEVPLPIVGDQRAWDAIVDGPGWRIGVEAETSLRDGQALLRRLRLKARDGGVDGLVLLLRGTRSTRRTLAESGLQSDPFFGLPGREALIAFATGARPPAGNTIIVLPLGPGVSSRPTAQTDRPAAPRAPRRSMSAVR